MEKIALNLNDVKRMRVLCRGRVQGVGFRPTIWRIANSMGLCGWVMNTSEGVLVEIEGNSENVTVFLKVLKEECPPLSHITSFVSEILPFHGYERFEIRESEEGGNTEVLIPADVSICSECETELLSIHNRRFAYPFINCTNCGPRFTIMKGVPYDRPKTTMSNFIMCKDCFSEYNNPIDRRFHAQPNACEACGPKVWFECEGEISSENPIDSAVRLIRGGGILAIKSLGGFHLSCNVYDISAIKKLRERKNRPDKPLAIMCRSLKTIKEFCKVSYEEEKVLFSPEHPIVLLKKRKITDWTELIAPRNKYLGVMLPYTPLHILLFERGEFHALVMTSGNRIDEPICRTNEEAKKQLFSIADGFLFHDREIHNRCDDSIVKIVYDKVLQVRRSRGFVPNPISLEFEGPSVLACGALLKNTFCLTRGGFAFPSQYIGDTEDMKTMEYYCEAIERLKKMLNIEPEIIAYDLHPDYLTTRFALNSKYCRRVGIQHHHAHIASVMAEHGIKKPVIGVAFDGAGYGTDGRIWGGEFLLVSGARFKRMGHLSYISMPGGDKAVLEPYRMAFSVLKVAGFSLKEIKTILSFVPMEILEVIETMMEQRINVPLTSSVGRLFDAISCILGFEGKVTYEGQAACELEAICRDVNNVKDLYSFEIKGEDPFTINYERVVREIYKDKRKEVPGDEIARKFHYSFSRMIVEVCKRLAQKNGISLVVLSGGVFQNEILLRYTLDGLREDGLFPYINELVPTNDGGISIGQAWIALQKEKQ